MSGQPDIDIRENYIKCLDAELLSILLKDRSSGKNIIWATDIYASKGASYDSPEAITVKLITGRFGKIIRPRIDKSQKEQKIRIKDKAEVFTPSWICNEMNNHLCDEWFEKKDVFNTAKDKTWIVDNNKIPFTNEKDKTWQDFVKLKVLEISCGEAPFLASRYDTTTGKWIDVNSRIGALDRKSRVINENCDSEQDWYNWTLTAFKSTFGYEWQGDSLLIARENLLFTFIDYYIAKFGVFPIKEYLIEIAKILSWNIWQMDGLKDVIPNSCKPVQKRQMSLFEDEETEPCLGCAKNDNSKHTGIYSRIMNWETKRSIKFFKGEKRMKFDFVIGNPPYQETLEHTSDAQIYNYFMDAAYNISDRVELITPAKFLYNAGKTPKNWNKKMLSDEHLKLVKLYETSAEAFPGTKINGGICITYRDSTKKYKPIGFFGVDNKVVSITEKVRNYKYFVSINTSLFLQNKLKLNAIFSDFPNLYKRLGSDYKEKRIVSSAFETMPEIFSEKQSNGNSVKIWGKNREYKYIDKKYLLEHPNTDKYKIILSAADGASGTLKTDSSTRIIGKLLESSPKEGYTQTFISLGAFDDKNDSNNLKKYLCGKFCRFMVGTLKATNGLKKEIWSNVPLQDFTDKSDIDWSKSIHEIDLQLYKKYGLDQNEIDFIESHIKEMK